MVSAISNKSGNPCWKTNLWLQTCIYKHASTTIHTKQEPAALSLPDSADEDALAKRRREAGATLPFCMCNCMLLRCKLSLVVFATSTCPMLYDWLLCMLVCNQCFSGILPQEMFHGPSRLWSCSSLIQGQGALERQPQPSHPVPRMEATLQK